MDYKTINDLIEKYFSGETSLEEENLLKIYFNGLSIDPALSVYTPLFQFFNKEKEPIFSAHPVNIHEQYSKRNLWQTNTDILWKIAATFVCLVMVSAVIIKKFDKKTFLPIAQQHKAKIIILDGDDDPKVAYTKIKAALHLASKKMKIGTDETTDGLYKLKNASQILHRSNQSITNKNNHYEK
jgi:hypothetical protein